MDLNQSGEVMKRPIMIGIGAIVLAGLGYAAYSKLMGDSGGNISRLTTTNINLGATALPVNSATCGTDPGTVRLVCLTDLLKSGASPEVLAYM